MKFKTLRTIRNNEVEKMIGGYIGEGACKIVYDYIPDGGYVIKKGRDLLPFEITEIEDFSPYLLSDFYKSIENGTAKLNQEFNGVLNGQMVTELAVWNKIEDTSLVNYVAKIIDAFRDEAGYLYIVQEKTFKYDEEEDNFDTEYYDFLEWANEKIHVNEFDALNIEIHDMDPENVGWIDDRLVLLDFGLAESSNY